MKRILGIVSALAVVGVAAAQSTSLDFDVNVAGTTAIAVDSIDGLGGTFIEDLNISYDLNSDQTLVFTGESGFQLRYITNRTGDDATISQANCEFDAGVEGDITCGADNTASAEQFESAYITVAAGALDSGNLVAVDAFENALSLNLQTGSCVETALANDFTVPPGFGAYEVKDSNDEVIESYGAVDFSDLAKARAQANIGASQAGGEGLAVAFDGVAVDLIGDSGDEESQIRGAACGPTAGTGMEVTVSPVIDTSKLLPEGSTEVALVLTIHQTTDD